MAVAVLRVAVATPSPGLMPDIWVATDGLGRRLPTFEETGGPRKDRTVALFYSIWHEDLHQNERFSAGPFGLKKILAVGRVRRRSPVTSGEFS